MQCGKHTFEKVGDMILQGSKLVLERREQDDKNTKYGGKRRIEGREGFVKVPMDEAPTEAG